MEMDNKMLPWNTTQNFQAYLNGETVLTVSGDGDPTGRAGEGFAFLKSQTGIQKSQVKKQPEKKKAKAEPKRSKFFGTVGDLRALEIVEMERRLMEHYDHTKKELHDIRDKIKKGIPYITAEGKKKLNYRWALVYLLRRDETEQYKETGNVGHYVRTTGSRIQNAKKECIQKFRSAFDDQCELVDML